MRRRFATAAICSAVLMLLAGCPDSTTNRDPRAVAIAAGRGSHSGFFIEMPLKAGSPGDAINGGAIIAMKTNLPEGTIAYVTSAIAGGTSYAFPGFLRVSKETFRFYREGQCVGEPQVDMTRGFNVTLIVVPDQSQVFTGPTPACKTSDRCGAVQLQPRSVLDVLGRNFEKLKGEQVTTINDTRALVASAEFAWPNDACTEPVDVASGAPRICRETTASIDDDEGGANLKVVAGSPIGLLGQEMLCDLYNYATTGFQKANPWPRFKDRTKAWVKAHRPLMGDNYQFFMSNRITGMGPKTVGIDHMPEWLDVDYYLRGKKVAHAHFVASRWYSGYTKWDMATLELL